MKAGFDVRRAATEALGTFFLVLIGPGAAMVDAFSGGRLGPVGIALAFAFVITAVIFATGHISGAHINPAVTLAFLSFALMFVIMAAATDERSAGGSAAFAVGLTVGFCALVGGPITSASMNPGAHAYALLRSARRSPSSALQPPPI